MFLVVALIVSNNLHSQDNPNNGKKSNKVIDSLKAALNDEGDDDDWNPAKMVLIHKLPVLQINYGFNTLKLLDNDYESSLNKFPNFEARLGTYHENVNSANKIVKFNSNTVYVSLFNQEYGSNTSDNNKSLFTAKMFRFGFFDSKGYGYDLGENASLILYTGGGVNWSRIISKVPEFKDTNTNFYKDQAILNTIGDDLRFGQEFETGIKVKLFKPLALNASFERSVIFPRHLVFDWLVSNIIEGIGNKMLDSFSKSVMKSSAAAGPIVNFVLKTVYEYGFYELRKSKMNWPFNSVSPLLVDSYKVGLSFEF